MSDKNFMSYGDAESVLTEFASDIKEKVSPGYLKSTVGWTGKNHAIVTRSVGTTTANGVTVTVYEDGSFYANGTSTEATEINIGQFPLGMGKYIYGAAHDSDDAIGTPSISLYIRDVNGQSAWIGSWDTVQNRTLNVTVDSNVRMRLYIAANSTVDTTFYPMIRDSGIADATYEPHHDTVEVSKADKVTSATEGNLARLDANGNLTDSGESVDDIYSAMAFNGVKNLARLQYDNGYNTSMGSITHTYNNGEVTLSAGTASAQSYSFPAISTAGFELEADRAYVLTGVPSNAPEGISLRLQYNNGSNVTVATDDGSGASFTFTSAMKNAANYRLMINVASGTVIPTGGIVIRPMIRYAEDKGTAFEKHTLNNRELDSEKMSYADNGVLGAKNLWVPNRATGSSSGLTWTSDEDGIITVTGQNTGQSSYYICILSHIILPKGTYIFSGCPANSLNMSLFVRPNSTNQAIWGQDDGDSPKVMTLTEDTDLMGYIRVGEEVNVGTQVFKPMITLASDARSNYANFSPYAMTNKQLTDALAYLEQTVTLSTSADTTVTFSDAKITTDSLIDIATSEWGLVPSDVTVTTGVCTVTLPKADSAHSVKCRIYVR